MEREHDNLRAALRYFVEGGDTGRGTRLAAALRRFWWIRGHTDEARTWFTTLVEHARRDQERCAGAQTTLARALTGAALFAYLENTSEALGLLAGEAVALCRRLDDREMLAEALHLLGHYYLDPGTDYEAARAHFDESATRVPCGWRQLGRRMVALLHGHIRLADRRQRDGSPGLRGEPAAAPLRRR